MTMMKCGHRSQGVTSDNKPYCIICDCDEIMDEQINLTGRIAKCCYCGKEESSSFNLPLFEYRKDCDTDSYYCGCEGWD